MVQVNACLRRTFTFFNILFAVLGGVIIGLALLFQTLYRSHGGADFEGGASGLILLYVVGGITMAIAILGAYGAQKENRAALIVFLVCMVLGTLLMLKAGVSAALNRTTVQEELESKFRGLLPLDKSADNIQDGINSLQTTNFPWPTEKFVFRETCFPVIMYLTNMVINICLAVIFSLATLALLGMVLSSIIIHQMRQKVSRPTVFVTIPAVFTPQPPKYQELYNSPEY
ncbi:hypothetical protein CRUP_013317 [Coryphaenoides rupestris]|nr:hypothetical protein CRUP_013317 [Coryphaenoides rupestris]